MASNCAGAMKNLTFFSFASLASITPASNAVLLFDGHTDSLGMVLASFEPAEVTSTRSTNHSKQHQPLVCIAGINLRNFRFAAGHRNHNQADGVRFCRGKGRTYAGY